MEIDRLASILKCESAALPFTYLGLSVGANMKLAKYWSLVIEKVKRKLSNWKAKSLSFGERLTLVNLVLSSLLFYYFSPFRAPKKAINILDGLRRRFLWGGDEANKKSIRFRGMLLRNQKKMGV